jgi:hypothetical protein
MLLFVNISNTPSKIEIQLHLPLCYQNYQNKYSHQTTISNNPYLIYLILHHSNHLIYQIIKNSNDFGQESNIVHIKILSKKYVNLYNSFILFSNIFNK